MPAIIWILIGAATIAALLGKGKGTDGRAPGKNTPVRIDHPRYFEEDVCECSVCGERFRKPAMVCPRCGVRFAGTMEDDTEFDEEMMEAEEWEEEEN